MFEKKVKRKRMFTNLPQSYRKTTADLDLAPLPDTSAMYRPADTSDSEKLPLG
jgi:hypothetical protein